jgi:O-antigen/teichoic acid export membrane protein
MRGAALTVIAFGGSNLLRLASNLILTRILFPEAFGLMALVQVFIAALNMFSDTGINKSLIQSKRGDDPSFLNTAWTVQIIRGVILWGLAAAVALPAAALYDEPMLAELLPVVGATAFILGFMTTNVATANRHLMLGRITVIDLGAQLLGLSVMVTLAYMMESVWALVIGGLLTTFIKVLLQHLLMPGIRNRLHWDPSAFSELFSFGKFIFLSTAVTFVIAQGDKAILGGFISLAELGVYNIGYFLGSIPYLLAGAVASKVIFPLYRMKPIQGNPGNRAKVLRARRMVVAMGVALLCVMGFASVPLVELLYDPRYALAGPVITLMSLSFLPRVIISNYGAVLLAAGDSRAFFSINLVTAVVQTGLMFLGAIYLGIFGVVLANGLALLVSHPLRVYQVRQYEGWDPKADLMFFTLGIPITGIACWLYRAEIALLIP